MQDPDASPTSHVFVYGTLLAAVAHPLRNLLAEHGRPLGDATCQGALYDVGPYPAAVASDDEGDRIHGEGWLLDPAQAEMVLTTLDHYEGCPDDEDGPALYLRRRIEVTLEDGQVVEAWIWLYNRPLDGLRRIEPGDWLRRSESP